MGNASTPTDEALHVEHPLGLWVDDQPPEILRLQLMLIHNGLHVRIAESFDKAKGEVRERPFDLMILDLRLDKSDGIELLRYARTVTDKKHRRPIHFIAVTNFKHQYMEELRNNDFTFVYEKDELKDGRSKIFVEDCLFCAVDSRMRADYPELTKQPVLQSVEPESVKHVCCDVGYILRQEHTELLVRLWRCGAPGKRTIRIFDRSFLRERGVSEEGQPFRVDTFEGKEDMSLVTQITPLHQSMQRLRRRVAPEIDLERFRGTTDS